MNNILCFYLRKNNYPLALSTLRKIRNIDSLNALLLATQVVLNAKAAYFSGIKAIDKKTYLKYAISLGQMFMEIEQEKKSVDEFKLREELIDIHSFLSN